jgi:antirestriction protein ArdC
MRYAHLYEQIKKLVPGDKVGTEGLNKDGWMEFYHAIPHPHHFVPTGFDNVDALVHAHSPVIIYTPNSGSGVPFTAHNKKSGSTITVMPPPLAFESPELYASVLLHELSHWTRWKMPNGRDFQAYMDRLPVPSMEDMLEMLFSQGEPLSRPLEELTAETSAYLLTRKLIPEFPAQKHILYLRNWRDGIREGGYTEKETEKFVAVSQDMAFNAASFLLAPIGLTPQSED